MKALIDMDIITYRSAFTAERVLYKIWAKDGSDLVFETNSKREADEWIAQHGDDDTAIERTKVIAEPEVAKMAAKAIMESILDKLQASDYRGFLTGTGNFRDEIATIKPYKGHRPEKPVYHGLVRDYLIDYWKAEVVHGMEADDKMGIEQCTFQVTSDGYFEWNKTIICSNDKDLRMIPGWHYNFVKDEKEFVDEITAWRNFYRQCITGDSTDNIPGLFNITGRKATKRILSDLDSLGSVHEMSSYVQGLYKGHEQELEEIAQLLWILREPREEL